MTISLKDLYGVTDAIGPIHEFDAAATYNADDLVVRGGSIYRAKAGVAAGAFDPTEWEEVGASGGGPITEFDATEAYAANDIVVYQGSIYKAKAAVTAGAWDATEWEEVGAGGGEPIKEFNDTETYNADSVVVHEGSVYKAKAPVAAGAFDETQWELVVSGMPLAVAPPWGLELGVWYEGGPAGSTTQPAGRVATDVFDIHNVSSLTFNKEDKDGNDQTAVLTALAGGEFIRFDRTTKNVQTVFAVLGPAVSSSGGDIYTVPVRFSSYSPSAFEHEERGNALFNELHLYKAPNADGSGAAGGVVKTSLFPPPEYQMSSNYFTGQCVTYKGKTYVATQDSKRSPAGSFDGSEWDQLPMGVDHYDENRAYPPGSAFVHNQRLYISRPNRDLPPDKIHSTNYVQVRAILAEYDPTIGHLEDHIVIHDKKLCWKRRGVTNGTGWSPAPFDPTEWETIELERLFKSVAGRAFDDVPGTITGVEGDVIYVYAPTQGAPRFMRRELNAWVDIP